MLSNLSNDRHHHPHPFRQGRIRPNPSSPPLANLITPSAVRLLEQTTPPPVPVRSSQTWRDPPIAPLVSLTSTSAVGVSDLSNERHHHPHPFRQGRTGPDPRPSPSTSLITPSAARLLERTPPPLPSPFVQGQTRPDLRPPPPTSLIAPPASRLLERTPPPPFPVRSRPNSTRPPTSPIKSNVVAQRPQRLVTPLPK